MLVSSSRFYLRRLLWFAACLSCVLALWTLVGSVVMRPRSPNLHYESEQILSKGENGTIRLTTSYTQGFFIGLPVWQVFIDDKRDPILTVERVFQESQPGRPMLDTADKKVILRDEHNSYSYDLTAKSFLHNTFPTVVYPGPYRSKP